MSNLQPAQFQQLQMLMKPSEMSAMPGFEFGDADSQTPENIARLRDFKLREADSPGGYREHKRGAVPLTDQIRDRGVETPLTVFLGGSLRYPYTRLGDGHHRYFVQERREQAGEEVYLPVRHR